MERECVRESERARERVRASKLLDPHYCNKLRVLQHHIITATQCNTAVLLKHTIMTATHNISATHITARPATPHICNTLRAWMGGIEGVSAGVSWWRGVCVCVCVCVCVRACVCACAYMCVWAQNAWRLLKNHTYTRRNRHRHKRTHTRTHTHTQTRTLSFFFAHTDKHTHMHI